MQLIPTGGALGAEIRRLDLTQPLSVEIVTRIRKALLEHCVVFFRSQRISEEDQVRFTGYFGTPVEHVRKQPERPVPEIFIISNVEDAGQPVGALGNGEIGFHSDLSYLRKPGTFSLLYAVEVPRTGGATQWVNCYQAYEELDQPTKNRLTGLRAIHRHYIEDHNSAELIDHPVVRTHPETRRKSLYVGPHLTKSIVGLPDAESRDLLETLIAHATQSRYVWTHDWQAGDLIIWDNRPTMHRREPFPPTERRIMKRTQIFGEEVPFE